MAKKVIRVSDEQRGILSAHLGQGLSLASQDNWCSGDKTAWMHKAASLLHLVSPRVSTMHYGVAARLFGDLRNSIDWMNSLKSKEMDFDARLNERFLGALGGFEGLVEYLRLEQTVPTEEDEATETINAYFFDIPPSKDDRLVFVLMPFSEPWSTRMWESHIKPTVVGLKLDPPLQCKRADDLYGHDVMRDVVGAIAAARVIIADITGRNPNVFYELGIAHWMGKRVVLLSQSVDDIPFDLLRFRHILYEDNSDGYPVLKRHLEAAILECVVS